MDSFQISQNELPLIYMLSSDGEGFLQYPGEILEKNLSGWILRNSAPSMGELTITTAAGNVCIRNKYNVF